MLHCITQPCFRRSQNTSRKREVFCSLAFFHTLRSSFIKSLFCFVSSFFSLHFNQQLSIHRSLLFGSPAYLFRHISTCPTGYRIYGFTSYSLAARLKTHHTTLAVLAEGSITSFLHTEC